MVTTLDTLAICGRCKERISAGQPVDVAEVKTMGGFYKTTTTHPAGAVCRSAKDRKRAAERVAAATPAPVAPKVSPLATDRQVWFALDLMRQCWMPAVLGGRRPSESELRGMSRERISGIINALVNERDLQGA